MSVRNPEPGDGTRSTAGMSSHPDPVLQRIGRYRLLETLGEGGMGVVYLAEQTDPIRRRVALKLIKPGMDSGAVLHRFEAERQAMALMDHECIARVFDGGTTEAGLPYFVMEYVRGEPIVRHCDRQRLTITERLNLFVRVCEAVQHAHQKGVIHRDLKPSNILVEYVDGRAMPKVIDFGVAKALEQRLTERTLFTRHGQFVGTPEYMSPEQAEMGAQDIDTRSDIYTLGVVLYELIAGAPPFAPETLRAAGDDEIRRIIREVDPPKPSTRLSSFGEMTPDPKSGTTVETIAGARRADPRTLRRLVRGDLDWIIMRCLEKDRERRYHSCDALAADLRRHLLHEPVSAGPPSLAYRARKFVRRNRAPVSVAATVLIAIVAIGATAAVLWQREIAQRERADAAVADAEMLLSRLSDVVLAAPATDELGPEELLAERAIVRDHAENPAGEARARVAMAERANANGRVRLTLHHAERALELTPEAGLAGTQTHLDALTLAGIASRRAGLHSAAIESARDALSVGETLFPDEPEMILSLKNNLAIALRQGGRTDEAAQILEEIVEARTALLGPDDRATIRTRLSLNAVRRSQGRIEEAVAEGRRIFDDARRSLGPEHPDTLNVASNLSLALTDSGRAAEAAELCRDTLAIAREAFGTENIRTATIMRNHAHALRAISRHGEAERLLDEAIAIRFTLARVDDPTVLEMLMERADSLMALKRAETAEAVLLVAEALADRLGASVTERERPGEEIAQLRSELDQLRLRLSRTRAP